MKEIMPDGNLDLYKGMISARKSKYVNKYKTFFPHWKIFKTKAKILSVCGIYNIYRNKIYDNNSKKEGRRNI